jgi:hypothetical protein
LSKVALLVVLKTQTYGQEPKHQIELDALTGGHATAQLRDKAPAALVVDLAAALQSGKAASKSGKATAAAPLLDRLLADRGCALDPRQVLQ